MCRGRCGEALTLNRPCDATRVPKVEKETVISTSYLNNFRKYQNSPFHVPVKGIYKHPMDLDHVAPREAIMQT